MTFYLYILKSEVKDTYYIGVSGDPELRLQFHNSDSKGYTQRHRPWNLVFTRGFDTRPKALATEQKVKSWKSKKMIRLLIAHTINIDDYLTG